jgi:two-component system phosphate regulon response regulator PhoB
MRTIPRILIVEDEPAIAELIAVNLRHNGFQPVWAIDAETAQRELDEILPDVILLDWMLPGESGLTLARIRAVLRRRVPEASGGVVKMGDLQLDADTHRVNLADKPLKVGPTEFKLLQYLMRHPERVHSRGALLDKVWGDHVYIEERTVDVHVKRLRESLGEAGSMIETVRGAGYRFTPNPSA